MSTNVSSDPQGEGQPQGDTVGAQPTQPPAQENLSPFEEKVATVRKQWPYFVVALLISFPTVWIAFDTLYDKERHGDEYECEISSGISSRNLRGLNLEELETPSNPNVNVTEGQ